MTRREPLLTEANFRKRLQSIDAAIAKRDVSLQTPLVKPQVLLYANFRERYQQVFLGYSLDEDIDQLAARLPAVIDAYEKYVACRGHDTTNFASLDDYVVSLWLASFALLFDVNDAQWKRLLACIGNEGRDALFEAMVATRTPGRQQATGLAHAAIFEPLLEAIAADDDARAILVKRYLKHWYKALEDAYWIGTHLHHDSGFFGYWAVEVAGVVAAFDMDDSAFQDAEFYPDDLLV